ncbi:hypothetical protein EPO15_05260 [bacterium]|nr:MAG: hypothetical protein EPO15_05260 [bacterium]
MRPLPAAAALLLAASAALAQDDVRGALRQAQANADPAPLEGAPVAAPDCRDGIAVRRSHQFCDDVEECQSFCACACTFDPTQWYNDGRDRSVECSRAPTTGEGLLAPDAPGLAALTERPFRFIDGAAGQRATREVREGLRLLDDRLAASEDRARLNYRVRVVSCYRSPGSEVVKDCGLIRKAMHMLAKEDLAPAKRDFWTVRLDPNRVGRAWPGATPHTAGAACDLVLVDSAGADCFDWRAGVDGAPRCSIDQQVASRLLDQEATSAEVGAHRLDFEAWHYEWGTTAGSRCVHPDCADNHWPPDGSP